MLIVDAFAGGIVDIGATTSNVTFQRCRFTRTVAKEASICRAGAGGQLNIDNCLIEQTSSANVAIGVSSRLRLTNSLIFNNTVYGEVVSVLNAPGAFVRNITMRENTSKAASIIKVRSIAPGDTSTTTIADIYLLENRAATASVQLMGVDAATIDNLVCEGNIASRGGCVAVQGDMRVTLKSPRIFNNRAQAFGGAIHLENSANLTILDGLIQGNSAPNGGAFAAELDSRLNLLGSTVVSDNSARLSGGAFFISQSKTPCPTLQNSVVLRGNRAANGAVVFFDSAPPPASCSQFSQICSSCLLENNTATLNGDTESSRPVQLQLIGSLMNSYATSQRFDASFQLVDSFSSPLKVRDYVATATAFEWQAEAGTLVPVFLGGVTTRDFSNDKRAVKFDDLAFLSKPGSQILIAFSTEPPTSVVAQNLTVSDCPPFSLLYQSGTSYYCLEQVDTTLATSAVMTTIAVLGILCSVVLIIVTYLKRKESIIRKSSATFSIVICVGCMIMFAAGITFAWTTPGACGLRPWLLSIGFCLVYGSLFIKVRAQITSYACSF